MGGCGGWFGGLGRWKARAREVAPVAEDVQWARGREVAPGAGGVWRGRSGEVAPVVGGVQWGRSGGCCDGLVGMGMGLANLARAPPANEGAGQSVEGNRQQSQSSAKVSESQRRAGQQSVAVGGSPWQWAPGCCRRQWAVGSSFAVGVRPRCLRLATSRAAFRSFRASQDALGAERDKRSCGMGGGAVRPKRRGDQSQNFETM